MWANIKVVGGALLPIALAVAACGGGNGNGAQSSSRYAPESVSESGIKANYVAMARAVYDDSLATALTLRQAIDAFIADPTEAGLEAARAAYKAARAPYQQSEIMRWDTAITLANNLDFDGGPASVDEWEGQVNAWPLDENHIVASLRAVRKSTLRCCCPRMVPTITRPI